MKKSGSIKTRVGNEPVSVTVYDENGFVVDYPFKAKAAADAINERLDAQKISDTPENPSAGKPMPPPKLAAGVVMEVAIASSIGTSAMGGSVLILRNDPVLELAALAGDATGEAPQEIKDKACILVATDGRFMALSRGSIQERQARNLRQLVTRLPADGAKVGKSVRTLKFASGGDETLFGKKTVWVDDHRIYDAMQEVPAIPMSPINDMGQFECQIVEIPLNSLNALAAAINGVNNDEGAIIRLAIPRHFGENQHVRAIGSDGIGVILCKRSEDPGAYIDRFNDTAEDARRMWEQLPEHLRTMQETDAGEDGDETMKIPFVAPGEEGRANSGPKETREPWYAAWLCTPVASLDLSQKIRDGLISQGIGTISDLNAFQAAHPNKHFTKLKGIGPEKAELIGAAIRKVWTALEKEEKNREEGGAADTAAIAEESKTATAGIGGAGIGGAA